MIFTTTLYPILIDFQNNKKENRQQDAGKGFIL